MSSSQQHTVVPLCALNTTPYARAFGEQSLYAAVYDPAPAGQVIPYRQVVILDGPVSAQLDLVRHMPSGVVLKLSGDQVNP